ADGTLAEILKQEGETVLSGELIGRFNTGKVAAGASTQMAGQAAAAPSTQTPSAEQKLAPAARKLIEERQLDAGAIAATGKGGLITKEDVLKHLSDSATAAKAEPAPAAPKAAAAPADTAARGEREEKRVPMTRLRARIAERLLDAAQNTAMLTTFNEVNMQPVMGLRNQYKDLFEKTHNGTRLGFMGFFVK